MFTCGSLELALGTSSELPNSKGLTLIIIRFGAAVDLCKGYISNKIYNIKSYHVNNINISNIKYSKDENNDNNKDDDNNRKKVNNLQLEKLTAR